MAADRFLALVDAKEHLGDKAGGSGFRAGLGAMLGQRNEDLALVSALVGEVEDTAALEIMSGSDFSAESFELLRGKAFQIPGGQAHELAHFKQLGGGAEVVGGDVCCRRCGGGLPVFA